MPEKKEAVPENSKRESELEKLIKEKIELAKKLGLLDGEKPVDGYQESKEYERLKQIDERLWELV